MNPWAVTGASGFVGRHLTELLVEQGIPVRALLRRGGSPPPPGAQSRVVSLSDAGGLVQALTGCDVVAHLAAPRRHVFRTRGRLRSSHRSGDVLTLAEGVETLFRSAFEAGIRRWVLASSAAVYGKAWIRIDRSSVPAPVTPYARDRLTGEDVAARVAQELGAELITLRLSEIFGPGSPVHAPLVAAATRGDLRIVGSGDKSHQILHVRDAARAIAAAGRTPVDTPATTVVVSGPGNTLRDFVTAITASMGTTVRFSPGLEKPARLFLRSLGRVAGIDEVSFSRTLDYHVRPRAYDVGDSVALLGAYHRSSFMGTVAEMVDSFAAEKLVD